MINDEQLAVLRTLVDSRRSLGEDHSRMGAQVYHLLFELVPGGAQRFLSAGQAKQILAGVRPRNAAGKVACRVAAELVVGSPRSSGPPPSPARPAASRCGQAGRRSR